MILKQTCSYCEGEGKCLIFLSTKTFDCSVCKGKGYLEVDLDQRIKDLKEDISDSSKELLELEMAKFTITQNESLM